MQDEPAYEPGRLMRASQLGVRPHGPGEYEVQGSKFIRYVNLNSDQPCECEDCFYRGQRIRNNCKHTLAARLANGEMTLVRALGTMLLTAMRARGEEPEGGEE
jgi:hypothetical protein